MAHEFAGTLQQAAWIRQICAEKKAYIDMACEGIDVAECRFANTRSWVA